mmetsp:Transcript_15816/g.24063  ORF Transcript_15816/g.24063 Transcript_15816/m.24063 type:complete len:239 (+) Transcript_15816:275-991(+)
MGRTPAGCSSAGTLAGDCSAAFVMILVVAGAAAVAVSIVIGHTRTAVHHGSQKVRGSRRSHPAGAELKRQQGRAATGPTAQAGCSKRYPLRRCGGAPCGSCRSVASSSTEAEGAQLALLPGACREQNCPVQASTLCHQLTRDPLTTHFFGEGAGRCQLTFFSVPHGFLCHEEAANEGAAPPDHNICCSRPPCHTPLFALPVEGYLRLVAALYLQTIQHGTSGPSKEHDGDSDDDHCGA